MSKSRPRTIKVDALARVEGEGALYVRVRDGRLEDVQFRIVEPPRFFEALLRGRMYADAPDITARICGICPIAYMLGASQAMEDALGVHVVGPLDDLRRLIYCGEWIESHVLHAAMLHAPDFLRLPDALALAGKEPDVLRAALSLKKLGNHILEVIGGRAVHPVNLRVGGFYKAPSQAAIDALHEPLEAGLESAVALTRRFARFDFPDLSQDVAYVSLRHPDRYAIEAGRIVSDRGLDIAVAEFRDHFIEEHAAHSTALRGATRQGEPYLVGPLARYNNNYAQLSELARAVATEAGLGPRCVNPFQAILVRMVETVYACEEALRLVRGYVPPDEASAPITVRAGEGHGCTEAPRGICYHRYGVDTDGRIETATIVPPTAQNQRQIERDLRGVVEDGLALDDEALKWRCEQAIRNYDPCISCATHFLDLTVDRQ